MEILIANDWRSSTMRFCQSKITWVSLANQIIVFILAKLCRFEKDHDIGVSQTVSDFHR